MSFTMEFAGVINSEETMGGDLGDGRYILVECSIYYSIPRPGCEFPSYWLRRWKRGDFADPENRPMVRVVDARGRELDPPLPLAARHAAYWQAQFADTQVWHTLERARRGQKARGGRRPRR